MFWSKKNEESEKELPSNAEQREAAKAEALAAVDAASGNESQLAEIAATSEFAEARLAAAERVHDEALLRKIAEATQASDRRVYKLASDRLNALQRGVATRSDADQLCARCESLAEGTVPPANIVADLDRAWQQLGDAVPPDLTERFSAARSRLATHLSAQHESQRELSSIAHRAEQLGQELDRIESAADAPLTESLQAHCVLAEALVAAIAALDRTGLPPQYVKRVEAATAGVQQRTNVLMEDAGRVAARRAVLDELAASPQAAQNGQRRYRELTPPSIARWATDDDARFKTLIANIAIEQSKAQEAHKDELAATREELKQLSIDIEAALQAGESHKALDLEKRAHVLAEKAGRLPAGLERKLKQVHNELERLRGWERWGNQVAREGLIREAEELVTGKLGISERSKALQNLRDRWKEQDKQGGAPRELWKKFDDACKKAHEPVEQHLKRQNEQRADNLKQREAVCTEIENYAAEKLPKIADAQADWKGVASWFENQRVAWRKLGPVEHAVPRKDKDTIVARYNAACALIDGPLDQVRSVEKTRRNMLIQEAQALAAKGDHKGMVDAAKALQAKWQERAKALPLRHNDEEALWKAFREPVDKLFTELHAKRDADKAKHKEEMGARYTYLEQLEGLAKSVDLKAIDKALNESRHTWNNLGEMPRATEQKLKDRYKRAIDNLQKQQRGLRRDQAGQAYDALIARIAVCINVESGSDAAAAQAALAELPATKAAWGKAIDARMARATGSSGSPTLDAAIWQDKMLRLEMRADVESPAEYREQRMRLKIEALAAAMKNRGGPAATDDADALIAELAGSAAPSAADAERLRAVVLALKARQG